MMRALFAGVSGLRNHQTRMDVIGNNIANVNTIGFKASRVTFKESFAETLAAASRPTDTMGGLNPMQIGSGMNVGSIDQLFTQGSLESTGQPFDLAIQGQALFVLSNGERNVVTRAGNFTLDASGKMISADTGLVVQGINADATGALQPTDPIGNVVIPLGVQAPPRQTTTATLTGNLNANAAIGDTHTMGIVVYDELGAAHNLEITFTNTGPGAWSWTANCATAPPAPPTTAGTVTFNPDGSLAGFSYPDGAANLTLTPLNGTAFSVSLDPGTINTIKGLSGFANPSTAVIHSQDGYAAGDLTNVTVDATGTINGTYSNGTTRVLGQIALATFTNPSGLTRIGDNMFAESSNSGPMVIGFAGTEIPAELTEGALETSNVDISQEFSDMIIAERGFQASARVITVADQMLNELVNLKQ